jgi:hypothetical protein
MEADQTRRARRHRRRGEDSRLCKEPTAVSPSRTCRSSATSEPPWPPRPLLLRRSNQHLRSRIGVGVA